MHQNAGNEAVFVKFSGALVRAPYPRPNSHLLRSQVCHQNIGDLKFIDMSSPKDLTTKIANANTDVYIWCKTVDSQSKLICQLILRSLKTP
jgi:hypothetical protein